MLIIKYGYISMMNEARLLFCRLHACFKLLSLMYARQFPADIYIQKLSDMFVRARLVVFPVLLLAFLRMHLPDSS